MKLSLNWLKEYVEVKEGPQEMAHALTMHAVEVKEIRAQAELLDKVVIGRIKQLREHPNADKLKLVDTEVGDNKTVQIVCGGSNLKEGLWVAVALPGAKIRWHGEGEPVVLEPAKIRGETSEGMICLDSEIGLGETKGTEIMVLDEHQDKKVGIALADLLKLNDHVLDIDNKSITHRSDLFSHLGIAREYAAIRNLKLKLPKLNKLKTSNKHKLKVQVDNKELCPRYQALVLDNIQIKESPAWMQQRLIAAGMRPINNIVDITNYVMLEFGQPLHAFDYYKLFEQTIIIRNAKKTEKIKTLDGQDRELAFHDLVIADAQKPIAVAGVIGGENSEVDAKTKTIVLESANFNKTSVRKTAQRLGIRTEANIRFEKGLGLIQCAQAMQRAVALLIEYAGAEVSSKLHDLTQTSLKLKIIKVDLAYINDLAGIEIPKKKVISILNALELKTKEKKKGIIEVEVPLFRTDLNIPEDIIEEVTRVFGYDQITPQPLHGKLEPVVPVQRLAIGDEIRRMLVGWGFTEMMNYSFHGDQDLRNTCLKTEDHIELANPVSDDLKYLRITLLPKLLSNIKHNLDLNYHDLRLFEIGHVYFVPKKEITVLSVILTGDKEDIFFQAKGILEKLFQNSNIEYLFKKVDIVQETSPYANIFNNDVYSRVYCQGQDIGNLNLINQELLDNYGIKGQVGYFSIYLEEVSKYANTNLEYQALPKYPPVTIDLAVTLPEKYSWKEVRHEIMITNSLIKEVELFDLYTGEKVGKGNKSFAMHLVFQPNKKTLEMKEVEQMREEIVKQLNKKFKAEIRK